ncbi:MAG: glutathione S-transferase N-terminal domain-containing protein [Gammaproteobacteria bacterium]
MLTIPMSHYCEKVRWALVRFALPWCEEAHLQGFHYLRVLPCSRQGGVPVLLDDGVVVVDSTAILQYLDRRVPRGCEIYPSALPERRRVEELEELFDEVLGVESRRWFYFHYRNRPRAALAIAAQGIPAWEQRAGPWLFPFFLAYIRRYLEISEHTVRSGLQQARGVVDLVDELLADGRRYLVGDRFSAADLAFACMLAPLVLPDEYGVTLPKIGELPEPMRPVIEEFRQRPAGAFALHMFATERRAARPRVPPPGGPA